MLACDECHARSFEMVGRLHDLADVCCGDCGYYLGTFADVFAVLVAQFGIATVG